MPQHDLVIRGGLIATATDTFVADLGIRNGRIASIAMVLACIGARRRSTRRRLRRRGVGFADTFR